MPFSHLTLALLVALVWGLNFIFVKLALIDIPPLLLTALRFFLASIPAVFFIKKPAIPFKIIAQYGLVMFALQFAFLFVGLNVGMTPGMGAIIMQTQVFFSMFFAVFFLKEKTTLQQIMGASISFGGIIVVMFHLDNSISLAGFFCIIAAAMIWGFGNLITKKTQKINMLALVVWGSFVAWPSLFILSLVCEGPTAILQSFHQLSITSLISLVYIVYISTWVGYGVWSFLVTRYPVSVVVPFTLLIPVVGILSSVLFLGEPFYLWKLIAGLLVISGLFLNLFGARFFAPKAARKIQGT